MSRWNRLCLAIAGPAQLGDLHAPVRPSPPDNDICPRCGEPLAAHDAIRAKGNTLLKCRASEAGVAGGH
jgi:hypothetical protein